MSSRKEIAKKGLHSTSSTVHFCEPIISLVQLLTAHELVW